MKVYEKDNCVILEDMTDFLPSHTFDCGQCFRWEMTDDETYVGIAFGKVIKVNFDSKNIILTNTSMDDYENVWKDYFNIDNDYSLIKNTLSSDPTLKTAIDFGWGIRILNQDVFECLISFIISTQNAIPRIKKIVAKLCMLFGEKIEYENNVYYSFPTPEKLSSLDVFDLEPLKAGYRAQYILDAAKKVASGEVDLNSLFDMTTSDAKKELMKIKGVGPKVSDCVLLFSLKKYDAFPIDVWIGRVMKKFYLDEKATMKQIEECSKDKFQNLGGFAQQYLFYYARENKLLD